MAPLHTLAFWTPSPAELVIIMIIALLLFGRRLPEVARNLGKGVVEFKKGLKGVEDDIDPGGGATYQPPKSSNQSLPYSGPQEGSAGGASAQGPAQPTSAAASSGEIARS